MNEKLKIVSSALLGCCLLVLSGLISEKDFTPKVKNDAIQSIIPLTVQKDYECGVYLLKSGLVVYFCSDCQTIWQEGDVLSVGSCNSNHEPIFVVDNVTKGQKREVLKLGWLDASPEFESLNDLTTIATVTLMTK